MRPFITACTVIATVAALGPLLGLVLSPLGAAAAIRVTQEPAVGQMRIGERVLVDDGSCPAGQIKEVVESTNRQAAAGKQVAGVRRIRHCIKR
jgi:hypothetical protein